MGTENRILWLKMIVGFPLEEISGHAHRPLNPTYKEEKIAS
jgi:hypothetical protein